MQFSIDVRNSARPSSLPQFSSPSPSSAATWFVISIIVIIVIIISIIILNISTFVIETCIILHIHYPGATSIVNAIVIRNHLHHYHYLKFMIIIIDNGVMIIMIFSIFTSRII